MTIYTTSLTWNAIEELFTEKENVHQEILIGDTEKLFNDYLLGRLPGESLEEIEAALGVLQQMAFKVTQTIPDDYKRMLEIVKISNKVVRSTMTSNEAKILIEAYEFSQIPPLDCFKNALGMWLVLKSGEVAMDYFDTLSVLIDLETPLAEAYLKEHGEAPAPVFLIEENDSDESSENSNGDEAKILNDQVLLAIIENSSQSTERRPRRKLKNDS